MLESRTHRLINDFDILINFFRDLTLKNFLIFFIYRFQKFREVKDQVIEQVGSIDPMTNEHNEKLVALNMERVRYWLSEKNVVVSKPAAEIFGKLRKKIRWNSSRREFRKSPGIAIFFETRSLMHENFIPVKWRRTFIFLVHKEQSYAIFLEFLCHFLVILMKRRMG